MNKNIQVKTDKDNNLESVPYVLSKISAGFPSPADDYIENNLSLSESSLFLGFLKVIFSSAKSINSRTAVIP